VDDRFKRVRAAFQVRAFAWGEGLSHTAF
jgi:hypothetical protein